VTHSNLTYVCGMKLAGSRGDEVAYLLNVLNTDIKKKSK
jgi:hypothetical protein